MQLERIFAAMLGAPCLEERNNAQHFNQAAVLRDSGTDVSQLEKDNAVAAWAAVALWLCLFYFLYDLTAAEQMYALLSRDAP